MNLVSYLVDIYGYNTPIFIKDIRIGGKSKTAIRQEFYRASQRGELVNKGSGIYYIKGNNEFGNVITILDVLDKKYLYEEGCTEELKELQVVGYYSGLTFLNQIGLSQQVPAILEITTNRTSSKKRMTKYLSTRVILRKSRVTINYLNYKILQFLDMFSFVTMREVVKNKKLLVNYVKKNGFTKQQFEQYIKYYSKNTIEKLKVIVNI